ncbi:MAG: LamG domain-containing protein [Sphingobacteriales bacterium]
MKKLFFLTLIAVAALNSCTKKHNPVPAPKIDSLKVGLVAYYPFNFDSAVDSSGNGNDGTIYNITSVPDRFGKANSAYYFNGVDSYIDIKDNQALRLSNTDFTLNYWVNLDEYISLSGSAVLAKNNGPNQNGWNTSITGYGFAFNSPNNYGHAFYNVSGGPDPYAVGNQVIATANWGMVTVQYNLNKQQISIYINGVLDTTVSNIPTPNANTSVDLFIGKNSYVDPSRNTPAYFIKGKLDDIRIYNRILSNSQIQQLHSLTY